MADLISAVRAGPRGLGWRAMPWFIRQATRFSALFVAVWVLFIPFAALNIGTYSIDGAPVSGRQFLVRGYLWLTPLLVVFCAMAYGGWTERLWARWVPFVFAVVVCAYLAVQEAFLWDYAPWAVLYLLLAGWYSFFKRSVAAYYARLAT